MIRNNVISVLTDDYNAHIQLLKKLERELESLTEGRIHIKDVRGKIRYYQYIPSAKPGIAAKQLYLGNKDKRIKEELCRRKYIELSIPVIKRIIELERCFIEKYKTYDPIEMINNLPEKYRDISHSPIQKMVERNHPLIWAQAEYNKSDLHPERLTYRTQNDLRVRSKSELIIANQLEVNEIPFRYEEAIDLNGRTFYPDFTILNPRDNRIIYWEHFGMVDDADYQNSMIKKLDTYKANDILLWNNLIVTFESESNPLDIHKIRDLVKYFLLPQTLQ